MKTFESPKQLLEKMAEHAWLWIGCSSSSRILDKPGETYQRLKHIFGSLEDLKSEDAENVKWPHYRTEASKYRSRYSKLIHGIEHKDFSESKMSDFGKDTKSTTSIFRFS